MYFESTAGGDPILDAGLAVATWFLEHASADDGSAAAVIDAICNCQQPPQQVFLENLVSDPFAHYSLAGLDPVTYGDPEVIDGEACVEIWYLDELQPANVEVQPSCGETIVCQVYVRPNQASHPAD